MKFAILSPPQSKRAQKNFGRKKSPRRSPRSTSRLPGTPSERGSLHPLTQMLDRSIEIFRRMGFALADGPDIEDEWHCFDALNTPPEHPARNEQDTFYLPDGRLLRTHTSTVQIRAMQAAPPPIARDRAGRLLIAATKSTRPTARSFIRSKDFTSMKTSASRT